MTIQLCILSLHLPHDPTLNALYGHFGCLEAIIAASAVCKSFGEEDIFEGILLLCCLGDLRDCFGVVGGIIRVLQLKRITTFLLCECGALLHHCNFGLFCIREFLRVSLSALVRPRVIGRLISVHGEEATWRRVPTVIPQVLHDIKILILKIDPNCQKSHFNHHIDN